MASMREDRVLDRRAPRSQSAKQEDSTEMKYRTLKSKAISLLDENQGIVQELVLAKETIKLLRAENDFLTRELLDLGSLTRVPQKHTFQPPKKKAKLALSDAYDHTNSQMPPPQPTHHSINSILSRAMSEDGALEDREEDSTTSSTSSESDDLSSSSDNDD